jgi:hypothetical protein
MKPVLDLSPGACRYPVSEQDGRHLFCAAPASGGPYCPEHKALCYRGTARPIYVSPMLTKVAALAH